MWQGAWCPTLPTIKFLIPHLPFRSARSEIRSHDIASQTSRQLPNKDSFATVFRARDPDLDWEIALKVLDPLLMRDPVWVQRFRHEAKAIARLKHPRRPSVFSSKTK